MNKAMTIISIFSKKIVNRNSQEEIKKDLDFLQELKESLTKAIEHQDKVSMDHVHTLINDWIDELSGYLEKN